MQTTIQMLRTFLSACRPARATMALGLLLIIGFAQSGVAQAVPPGTNPLTIFKNYFVTGDYVVAGWVEQSSNGTYATGTISFPDPKNPAQGGLLTTVPVGADVVAAYLYWGTVEGNQSAFQGQQAFFNGYQIVGDVLGNKNSPTSWSSGGCSGNNGGSKTIRFYRADVRPYLPVDTNSLVNGKSNPTYGYALPNGPFTVMLADSGSNGNTQPNALGATLVIIYRVLNPPKPLNAIVLYDGSYAPFNTAPNVSQQMVGFYQPNLSPTAKLTHIVANGQPNKGETVSFASPSTGSHVLLPLYTAIFGQNSPPFPGLYGMWDNPTWSVGGLMMTGGTSGFDTWETTSVVPASTGSGCVDWGAIILSTTVQDSDGDGLLDTWEDNQGYTNAVPDALGNYQWVALPGASKSGKDIFVELDYLTDLDGSPTQHSHLPKQAALDAVGNALSAQGINIHFDVGSVYQSPAPGGPQIKCGGQPCDPYIITNPAGTGGNAIPENLLLCTDTVPPTPPLCAYPNQPAISWKGGFVFVRDTGPNSAPPVALGNFQPGRGQSYHYVLSGHSLGEPRSFWSTYGAALADPTIPQLTSIVNSRNTATVTIQTPPGVVKPGDCPNAGPLPAFCDANYKRVTITGALGPPNPATGILSPQNLNGTYLFTCNQPCSTFTITTSGVPDGTYNFSKEPQLAVAYLGPTSSSGHSDFGGGGDSEVTLGLWGADDPIDPNTGLPSCEPDPSQPLQPLGKYPAYCNNQVGTLNVQIGTLLHELGHTLTLTHGGTYYNDPTINGEAAPSFPTYEPNCKSNFLSVMSYLFQVRGFVDGGFDYSGQTMPPLSENGLNETNGIGLDLFTQQSAVHYTRWYGPPNAIDQKLQSTTGGRYATVHCDGTLITDGAQMVRVDGSTYSSPIDWNNNLTIDAIEPVAPQDANFNGSMALVNDSLTSLDLPFNGFNDWQIVNPTATSGVALQQMSARAGAFEFSGGGGAKSGSGGAKSGSGGIDDQGGGAKSGSGGAKSGSGGAKSGSGGIDQNEDTATSTVDAPTGLTCTASVNSVPGCVNSLESAKSVPLTWSPTGFGQIRRYDVWRAVGNFPTRQMVLLNLKLFTDITVPNGITGTPPSPSYVDPNVKNGVTYTYFVTEKNKQGAASGQSDPIVVTVKF